MVGVETYESEHCFTSEQQANHLPALLPQM